MGCYLHGLFEDSAACMALLKWAGLEQAESVDYQGLREQQIDRLADTIETELNMDAILT